MSQVGEDVVLRLEHQDLSVHLLTNARVRRLSTAFAMTPPPVRDPPKWSKFLGKAGWF